MSWIEDVVDGTLDLSQDWGSDLPKPGYPDAADLQDRVTQREIDLAGRVYDTGWQNLTVIAPQFSAGVNAPGYRRIGSEVRLRGIISRSLVISSGSSFNGAPLFNTLPANCWPAAYAIHRVWCGQPGSSPELEIFTDGTIQIRNMGTVDIPANQGIGLHCGWFAG